MPMDNGWPLPTCQSYRSKNDFRGKRVEMRCLDDWISVPDYEEFMEFMKTVPEVKPKKDSGVEPVFVVKSSYE